jgi:hypothetical protein
MMSRAGGTGRERAREKVGGGFNKGRGSCRTGESIYIRCRPGDRVGSGYGDKIELEAEECRR